MSKLASMSASRIMSMHCHFGVWSPSNASISASPAGTFGFRPRPSVLHFSTASSSYILGFRPSHVLLVTEDKDPRANEISSLDSRHLRLARASCGDTGWEVSHGQRSAAFCGRPLLMHFHVAPSYVTSCKRAAKHICRHILSKVVS